MKKLILLAAAAPLAFTGTAAFAADTATAELTLNGTVAPTCYVSSNPTATFTNMSGSFTGAQGADTASASGTITIDSSSLFDQTRAVGKWTGAGGSNPGDGNRTAIDFNFGAVCNFADSGITLSSANGGLVNTSPPAFSGNFFSGISYSLTGDFGGDSFGTVTFRPGPGPNGGQEITGPGESNVNSTALPTNDDINLRLRLRYAHNADGNKAGTTALTARPFLAGTYADTVTIRFGANP
ncbi:MAG: hypothetical protein GC147_12815 [Porphyrobacter sp.]|nr:hypothetical protein [Porphyrobacter sp.]